MTAATLPTYVDRRVPDPSDPDFLAGAHSVGRPELFAAYADRMESLLDGMWAQMVANTPPGAEITPTVEMAVNAIRAGLDLLCEVTEGARDPYAARQAVAS